ncbi:unnamed protein product [Adineta ricciae]|uniref:G-protein coupled receptors family 1 profile domain-containing protein n=1 Tax=Adineta ricciae TaxID=249248 RepID=A0A814WUT9_ADIRI|nr:unnamed protein product [Adineta ricciae]CAF1514942.1 unnamed protein product [Adineta ricciae]
MSSSNVSITEASTIRQNTIIFVQVWCYLMISLGTIGHTCSVYVFTRPTLRSNSCTWYFLAASMSGAGVVLINIPLRLLQAGYAINIYTNSLIACKVITFIQQWTRAQYAWFTALACVDRFLCSSSSATLRAYSSLHSASRTIPVTSLLVGIALFHIPVYFQINMRQQTCVPMSGIYQTFFGVWNLVIFSVGPPLVMLCFGLRTVQHIRGSIQRTGATNVAVRTENQRRKTTDRQLIQMMFVQCVIFMLTASLPSVQFIYTSVRSSLVIDDLQSAKDNLFYNVCGFVSLTVPCLSFYLFTLSSKLFRCELMKLFNSKWRSQQITVTSTSLKRRN